MKFMSETDAKNAFFAVLKNWQGEDFVKNLISLEKEDKIELMWKELDFDANNGEWDGTLLINLKKIKMDELVNFVLGYSRADEMSIDGKILRLWWD